MKRFFKAMSMALVAALTISCYDDSKVWEKLDSLEAKLAELTSQVNSVSSIISALEKNVYVKTVTEVTGGYEIEFTNGEKVTVAEGQKIYSCYDETDRQTLRDIIDPPAQGEN